MNTKIFEKIILKNKIKSNLFPQKINPLNKNLKLSIKFFQVRFYCETHENYKNPNAKKQRTKKIFPRETWEALDVKRREQDLLIRTFNQDYRIAFIINTKTARKAQEKHNLSGESALLLCNNQ